MKVNETPAPKDKETEATPVALRFAPVKPTQVVGTLDGLYIAGQVTGRRRTSFEQKGGGIRYNLSLSIITQNGKQIVERWSTNPQPQDFPIVGDRVCLPITLQHFTTKNGVATRLCWGATERGEDF